LGRGRLGAPIAAIGVAWGPTSPGLIQLHQERRGDGLHSGLAVLGPGSIQSEGPLLNVEVIEAELPEFIGAEAREQGGFIEEPTTGATLLQQPLGLQEGQRASSALGLHLHGGPLDERIIRQITPARTPPGKGTQTRQTMLDRLTGASGLR